MTPLDAMRLSQKELNIIFSGKDGWIILEEMEGESTGPMGGTEDVLQRICQKSDVYLRIMQNTSGDYKGTLYGRKVNPVQKTEWVIEKL
jgi:hypothetical protein